MRVMSRRRAAVVGLIVGLVVGAACSSDGPSVKSWNEERIDAGGFDKAANKKALAVLDRIERAGLECTARQTESWGAIAGPYDKVGLEIPLGSASCTGPGGENLLVEVFRRNGYPTAEDFMNRKRELLCKKGIELGRLPDGGNDFEGVPYVLSEDGSWAIEPDSVVGNRALAKALGLEARNACAGMKGLKIP